MGAVVHVGGGNVVRWAIANLGDPEITSPEDIGECVAFGITLNRRPVAACIFNMYRPMPHGGDMRVIIVATNPAWCQRHVLAELFGYVFETAGCSRLTAVIREGNERSVKLCAGLGFRKEGVLRRGYNGKTNALIFGMLRTECRWLRNEQKGKFGVNASAGKYSRGHGGAERIQY